MFTQLYVNMKYVSIESILDSITLKYGEYIRVCQLHYMNSSNVSLFPKTLETDVFNCSSKIVLKRLLKRLNQVKTQDLANIYSYLCVTLNGTITEAHETISLHNAASGFSFSTCVADLLCNFLMSHEGCETKLIFQ